MADHRKKKRSPKRDERDSQVRQTRTGMAMREVRRELAVWLMAVRERIEELATAVDDLREVVKDKATLLHDEVDVGRLTAVCTALATAAGDLDMVFPKVDELPDMAGVAENWRQFITAPIASEKGGA